MRPKAFRIRDFKSIADSGVCVLSGDGITVLAGQNEAGKTAVLSALRDFDLEEGAKPRTHDYQPDERLNAVPTVSVQFDIDADEAVGALLEEKLTVPSGVATKLTEKRTLWITRDLQTGKHSLEPDVAVFWESTEVAENSGVKSASEESGAPAVDSPERNENEPDPDSPRLLQADEFAAFLRDIWPSFVYFDSFQDSLPRQVDFGDLETSKKTDPSAGTRASTTTTVGAGQSGGVS